MLSLQLIHRFNKNHLLKYNPRFKVIINHWLMKFNKNMDFLIYMYRITKRFSQIETNL
jgi:hypothetical protein